MATTDADRGRSTAQWFCLVFGLTLIVVGLLGFIVEPTFDTNAGGDPGQVDGEKLLLFEVNGWHNIVHILTGALLLAGSPKHATARTAALVFGVAYAAVTLWGLIDGQDILGLVPVNPADNILHLVLAALAIAVGLSSTKDRVGERGGVRTETRDRPAARQA